MKNLNLDLLFKLGLLGFFVLLMWESRLYPLESRLYPQIIGGVTIFLIVISLFQHFRKKGEKGKTDPEVLLRRRRFFQISLIIIIATALGFLGGFILSVLCYYVAYVFFQEDKSRLLRTISIGVALTVLFYISFGWFMKVPLLRGWLVNF